MEIWKDIEGFEGLYQVSNLGRVKSLERTTQLPINKYCAGFRCQKELILKQFSRSNGYKSVNLNKNGNNFFTVHRLVAQAFCPNPNGYDTVNHIDENKKNNRADNLEWCSARDNVLKWIDNHRSVLQKRMNKQHQMMVDRHNKNNREVINLDTGKKYSSLKELEAETGFNRHQIAVAICKGTRSNGFHWAYTGKITTKPRTRLKPISKKQTQMIKDYRKTGFEYWGKACLLCGRTESETRLVIHHKDKNRNNNTPTNLIPLCDRNFGCGAHNHMGTEGLAQLNAKIDAKLKELGI